MKAEDLKKIRAELGLSQSKLALRLGVDVGTVRRWEQKLNPITGAMENLINLTVEKMWKDRNDG